jgi:hypothetical protein
MATQLYLVLIETSGNQSFIFSTNKLKENVGASEATYRVCGEWLLKAIHTETKQALLWDEDPDNLRANLIGQSKNSAVEVMVAASGKALLLVDCEATAKQIITAVTCKALEDAPGVDVCGVYVPFDWENDNLGDINRKVHEKFSAAQASRPGVVNRFPRLPVIAECATSGLPAAKLCKEPGSEQGNRYVGRSKVSLGKEKFRRPAFDRIAKIVTARPLVRNLDNLENSEWLAIVHVDGNGLGEIFLKFHEHLKVPDAESESKAEFNRHYVDSLRKFSIALDRCTEKAFVETLNKVFPGSLKEIPMVPLILGGDDLTVICDGKYALQFTHTFLQKFEAATADSEEIKALAEQALGKPKLSACAGIAIVKPHFPFSEAYHLAESLIKSAKTVKQKVTWADKSNKLYPCSAIDFHIVYDSSNLDLERIRGHLKLDEGDSETYLYGKPYVVTKIEELDGISPNSAAWVAQHQWIDFEQAVGAIADKGTLPSSQAHTLRQTLFSGRAATEAYLGLIQTRYQDKEDSKLHYLLPLFYPDKQDGSLYRTRLLDAIDAQGFLADKTTPQP